MTDEPRPSPNAVDRTSSDRGTPAGGVGVVGETKGHAMEIDEVESLLAQYRHSGDRSVRNAVIEAHLHLARHAVRRLSRGDHGLEEDMGQVALMAIVRAADRYRPEHGATFATFAHRTVEGELKRYLRDRTWTVRPPRTRQEHFLYVSRAREELAHALGRSPTPGEVAAETGLSTDEVLGAIEAGGARRPNSLDLPSPAGDETVMRAETMSWEPGYGTVESHADLHDAIAVLDERERRILGMRFIEERSQSEIAAVVGCSQSYVSRIVRAALTKLRAEMDDERSAA